MIQTSNNYEKEVFNGDIGVVADLDVEQGELHVQFEERRVVYAFQELDELQLAYAISVHKSQGSEFPVVIVPLCTQHYTLLARNLLYTAVTGGKKRVMLVGQKQAIAMAVRNGRQTQRLTSLAQRLRSERTPEAGAHRPVLDKKSGKIQR